MSLLSNVFGFHHNACVNSSVVETHALARKKLHLTRWGSIQWFQSGSTPSLDDIKFHEKKVNVCTVVGHQNVHNCMITCDIYMINIWAIYMCLNSNSNLKIASHRRQMITWGRHSFGWVLHMVLYMLPFIFQWWSPFNNYTYIWQIVIPYFFHNLIAHKDLQFQNHFVFTMNEGQRSLGVEEPVRSS